MLRPLFSALFGPILQYGVRPLINGGGPQPVSISGSPSTATVGQPYTFTPTVQNGYGEKVFALTGTLPSGLNFNTTTGAITGTPTVAGTTLGLSITVTDDSGSAVLGPFSLTASEPGATAQIAWGADHLTWGADALVWG